MFEYIFPIFCFGVVITGIVVKGLVIAADMARAQELLNRKRGLNSKTVVQCRYGPAFRI